MRTFFKVLCVFFALGSLGQLIEGNFFPLGIIMTVIFGYFGWREQKEPQFNEVE